MGTALFNAVRAGNLGAIRRLLAAGTDTEWRGVKSGTALHVAAAIDQADAARVLIENGAVVDARAEAECTPLHIAVAMGKLNVATVLLDNEADIEAVEEKAQTPLHIAARHGWTQIVAALIERGANIDARDNNSFSPLHTASVAGSLETALLLCDRGADLEAQAVNSGTPLHAAAANDKAEIVAALAERGADLEALSAAYTPLHLAAITGRTKTVTTLLQHGANIEPLSNIYTPLLMSVWAGSLDTIRVLIENGADIESRTENGDTVLHVAAERGFSEALSFLLDQGTHRNLSVRNSDGCTPLHLAVIYGRDEIVDKLVAAGASLDIADNQGKKPFDYLNAAPGDEGTANAANENGESTSSMSPSASEEAETEAQSASKNEMLQAIESVKPDVEFGRNFVVVSGSVPGKAHIRFARHKFYKKETVVLKFYFSEPTFQNSVEKHSQLAESEYVCRIVESFERKDTGYPSCLVLEKGRYTLKEWTESGRPSLRDRKWCLHQVLTGVRDLHAQGIVHCDLKPSNFMFFADGIKWKVIDLDGAQKSGQCTVKVFTTTYAAPEVIRAVRNNEPLPIVQTSLDMWAFGIIVYEILTGEKFFGEDVGLEDVCNMMDQGRVTDNLNKIEDESLQHLLANLLMPDPQDRWSAVKTFLSDIFQVDNSTTTTNYDKVIEQNSQEAERY